MRLSRCVITVLLLFPVSLMGDEPNKNGPSVSVQRLVRLDKEAMKSFREKTDAGKYNGLRKLVAAIEPYKKTNPDDIDPSEALIVAIIDARVSFFVVKDLKKEGPIDPLKIVLHFNKQMAARGGVDEKSWLDWYKKIGQETTDALDGK